MDNCLPLLRETEAEEDSEEARSTPAYTFLKAGILPLESDSE